MVLPPRAVIAKEQRDSPISAKADQLTPEVVVTDNSFRHGLNVA